MGHTALLRLWQGRRTTLLALIAIGVAIAASWLAQALLTSQIFARVLTGGGWSRDSLVPITVALALVLIARPILVLLRQLIAQAVMGQIKADIRSRALRSFVRRSAGDPGAGRSGRDHAVVVDGVENLDAYLSGYVPQIGVTVTVVLAAGITMIVIDPMTGVIAICATITLPFLPRLWDRALAARGSDHWDAYQELHAEFVESMHGMTTLVTFGADERREQQLAEASKSLLHRTLRQLRISLIESGLSGFSLAAIPAVVLVTVALGRDHLSAFDVFALVLLSIELVRPFRDLASQWHAGYLGTFSGPGILDLLDEESAHATAASTSRAESFSDAAVPSADEPPLRLVSVTAHHPRASAPTLIDVTLTAHPGMTAIVGATGSGKSTLAAVACGLLAPDSGTVLLDGRALTEDERLRHVALVAQDCVLFTGTVADNIALGLPAGADDDVIVRAAETVGIGCDNDGFTLDTPVGENGSLVSGGQRQRVAIARALVQDRDLLILDEATSALDPESERSVLAALRSNHPDLPIIAITHRSAVADAADRVVTVDRGRIVADSQVVVAGRQEAHD
ncbi:ABC transporter ATP-binding protein/permease [Gordonia polyisoprenivorans]|uniref:ABC transporter ATP-binding protein/permease n=1 Tax=Gordonia polyisoprenivorans TaxID=84595 RepID=UPI001AD64B96|nr:ATP-binding cassette domain-containing protein [Gordonia polyisoprenivorans]QTI70304.1 ATP-binding cassette domain-containing protein [Gordonia polyisoprenivorans]